MFYKLKKLSKMKTTQKKAKYVEWLSAEVMHKATNNWLSELKFFKDEQVFFDDLVKFYTLQLIDSKHFSESKRLIDQLGEIEKKTNLFINDIETHQNELQIMVDGIDQPKEEESYKKEHRDLIIRVSKFQKEYRMFKKQLFVLIKEIIKESKQKMLLD